MKNSKRLTIFIIICLLLLLSIIAWGLNKGLDPMDEGTYLLSFSYHQQSPWQLSWWWAYIRILTKLIPSSILTFRIVRLLGSLISAFFLGVCFWKWFSGSPNGKRGPFGRVSVIGFIMVGGLLQFAYGTISIGYSHMNAYIINLLAGIFLLLFTLDLAHTKIISISLIGGILGVLLGIQLFVKFSTALMIFALFVAFLLLIRIRKKQVWTIYLIGALLVGAGITIWATIYLFIGVEQARLLLQGFSIVANSSTHDIISVLYCSYREILSEGKILFRHYGPVSAALFFLFWSFQKGIIPAKQEKLFLRAAILFLFSAFMYLSVLLLQHRPYATLQFGLAGLLFVILLSISTQKWAITLFGKRRPQLTPLRIFVILAAWAILYLLTMKWQTIIPPERLVLDTLIFVIVGILLSFSSLFLADIQQALIWFIESEKRVLTLMLLIMPFVGAFGTNAGVIDISLYQLAPGFAVMLIIVADIYAEINFMAAPPRQWFAQGLIGIIVLLATSQIIFGYIFQPYHLPTPLIYQTHSISNAPDLAGIRVDSDTKRFFEQLNRQIGKYTGFESRQPVIALYDMPGFVYASGNISPGATFFTHNGGITEVCDVLAQAQVDIKDAIILSNTAITGDTACLVALGINFPWGYEMVNELENPYPYMSTRGLDTISIYIPAVP